jgi:lambda family phage tail tape measure protein
MADLNYSVAVNTREATQSLDKLKKSAGDVGSAFDKLKGAIGGIAFGAVIGNILSFADSMQDLSTATGIAVENIVGLSQSFQANGGSAEGARKAIFTLNQQIEEAASGSLEAQDNFRKLGIGLKDLRSLSETDLLAKTIQGLAQITNASERTTLAQKMLGKEARGVNFAGVAGGYADAVAEAQKYSDAIRKAAEVQDKLEATLNKLQLALVKVIEPISEFIGKLDQNKINAFIDGVVKIGVAVGTLFVFSKAAGWVSNLVLAFTALRTGGATAGLALGGLGKSVELFRGGLETVKKTGEIFAWQLNKIGTAGEITGATINGFGKRIGFLLGGFARMLPLIGQVVAAVMLLNTAVELLTGKDLGGWFDSAADGLERMVTDKFPALAKAINELGEKLGMAPAPSQQRENDAELQRIKNRQAALEAEKKKQEELRAVRDKVSEAAAKEKLETSQYVQELGIGLSRQTEAIALETRMLELSKLKNTFSEDQVEIIKAQSQADIERLAIQRRFKDEIDNIALSMKAMDPKSSEFGIAANKIEELRNRLNYATEAYRVHSESLEYYITQQQNVNKLIKSQEADYQNAIKAIEDYTARQQQLGEILRGANAERVSATEEGDLIGLGGLNRQIREIEQRSKEAARAAQAAFAEAFSDEDGLTPEKAAELAQGLEQISKAYRGIADAQIANIEKSREFSAGLSESIQNFVSEAQNGANQARTYFETFSRGAEDAFVRFVQTGKLSFKDLANSLIADFARIQAKKALAGLFGGGSAGGGSIFSSIGKIFGFANGGNPAVGVPAIVGENGPELFIPRNAGTVVPNNQAFGGNSTVQNITYNIQATDAASFKSQLARDPSFVHAVVEQGRRSTPGGARR